MKKCTKCLKDETEVPFPSNPQRGDYRCLPCKRVYNKAYHQLNCDRNSGKVKKYKHKLKMEMCDRLAATGCVDCGEGDVLVLQFDHLHDKIGHVSDFCRQGRAVKMREEMEKCEVVCANCHIKRTAKRDGNWARSSHDMAMSSTG